MEIFLGMIIAFNAPIENDVKRLEKNEEYFYKRNCRKIILIFWSLSIIGIQIKWRILYESIFYTLFITTLSMIAGKIKYQNVGENT